MATRVEHEGFWGICPDGSRAESFKVHSEGLTLELMSYGARVTALWIPDTQGNRANVVLGHDALAPYLTDKAFFGCSVGRYANRIAGGRFTLEDRRYQLDINDPPNTLHGGAGGFPNRNWQASVLNDGVSFHITSPHGDQGFPGKAVVTATYRVDQSRITLTYEATTDRATVLNLTNHAYFNLAGEGTATVLDHLLQLDAEEYLPIDATAIPLGAPAAVSGTPFDFLQPRTLRERIHETDEQLVRAHGYDHNFNLRPGSSPAEGPRLAATVVDPGSGRRLAVATTEPGIQLYSGNYLDGTVLGRSGLPYLWRSALCLETQHWPDAPNHSRYPSTVLQAGQTLQSTTVWTFDTI